MSVIPSLYDGRGRPAEQEQGPDGPPGLGRAPPLARLGRRRGAALQEATALHSVTAAHASASRATGAAAAALIGVERLTPELDGLVAALEPYDSVELSWPFAQLVRTRALFAQHRVDALETVRLAGGAHARQPGSFAADVLAAGSIATLALHGDEARAAYVAHAVT